MSKIVVRKIMPPPFKGDVFLKEYRKVVQDIGKKAKSEFQSITKDWKHKVIWHYKTEERKGWIKFLINVNDDKAGDVLRFWNYGVKRHIIKPKKGDALAFSWSKGVSLGLKPSKKSDGRLVFKEIDHPGQKGHHEVEKVIIHIDKMFLSEAIKANSLAVKSCGHMIK